VSHLTLIRHGQASFFAEDYDCLSPLGETQVRQLGEYWVRQAEFFTDVYVGPRLRQQRSAELVGAEYHRARLSWPEPVVLPELDEYDLTGLMERLAPALVARDATFEQLVLAFRRTEVDIERTGAFQRMFERLLTHWQAEPLAAGEIGVETWSAFRERVARGLACITGGTTRGRRVAAFTSGGVIGTAVSLALDAPDRIALELSWRLRNGSLTNLAFTPGRLTLDDFNTMPHLPDRAQWTYR
jgi:broad specificity phosphatase PhoE